MARDVGGHAGVRPARLGEGARDRYFQGGTQSVAKLVAEGIEVEAERKTLVDLGIEFGQGYLLGRSAEERAAWTALLSRYPASANADRARARLEELMHATP